LKGLQAAVTLAPVLQNARACELEATAAPSNRTVFITDDDPGRESEEWRT